jgi:glucosylceramidase
MKNNNNWWGGSANTNECALKTDPAIRRAYVRYLVKAVELYRAHGIPLYALSMQNEPRVCQGFPSMRWPSGIAIRDFMSMLGVGLTARFKDSVELWTPTMNASDHSYFTPMLDDPYLKTTIKAVGLQYEGQDALQWLHTTYPAMKTYYTEMKCGGGDNQWAFAFNPSFSEIKFYLTYGSSGAMYWNMILEKNGNSGPMINFKQNACITIDTVAKTFTRQPAYWVLRHIARYLRPGSKVIKMTGSYAGNTMAVLNPDKSIGVVMQNLNTGNTQVSIRFGTKMVTATLPGSSFASFRISNTVGVHPAASMSQRGSSFVNKSFKISGDRFVLPGEFAGKICKVAVYNTQGRLLKEFSAGNQIVDLIKEFGVSQGVYVMRVKSVQ